MFCTQPHNHLDILVENEKISYLPCTVWSGQSMRPNEYRNEIKNIQTALKKGFVPKACEICQQNEKGGVISKRQSNNQITKDNNLSLDKIQSIGLRYGTLCNLKCMICDVGRSSNWYSDTIKLGLDVQPRYKYNKKYTLLHSSNSSIRLSSGKMDPFVLNMTLISFLFALVRKSMG